MVVKGGAELCAAPPHRNTGGQLPCAVWLVSEEMKARDLDLLQYVSLNFKLWNLVGNHEIS